MPAISTRLGTRLFSNLRFEANWSNEGDGWNREMACIDAVVTELEQDGWLVNQARMWLASHWTVETTTAGCLGKNGCSEN